MSELVEKLKKLKFRLLQRYDVVRDEELEYHLWLLNLFIQIERVPGHIAEIGVASGRNTVLFGKLIEIVARKALDTISGSTLSRVFWNVT